MVMMALTAATGYRFGVAHCNFSLRGKESDDDEQLVADEAQRYGVEFFNKRFDTLAEMERTGESMEMATRRLRYAWFRELCDEHGYTVIAIAHHVNDSIETFFINMLRGTGLRGLTGINTQLGRVVRPMMFATRKDIHDYAVAHHIPFREDSSNRSTKYLRNKVRLGEAKENRMSEEEIEAIGAGDQGMMFGYASNETPELMPYAISLAHKLALRLTAVRKDGTLPYLRPDGKTQVTVEYDENGKPARLDAVVLSTQHSEEVTQEQIHEDIKKHVFDVILPQDMVDAETKFFINPTGRFVIGGPHGDSGLTGRKIIVDTYGGYARHGGGAFSGKDPSKVDRSAAYMCRYIAKNIVAAGLAEKCEIQLSYAIGVAHPTSIMVDTFGTGKISEEKMVEMIRENFDLRPAGIIKMLDLRRPIYKQTAAYGHFGRTDLDLPWEKTDKAEILKNYL